MSSEQNKEVWESVDKYFQSAGTNPDQNVALVKYLVDRRLFDQFLLAGFSWVAEKIENEGQESIALARFGAPDDILDLKIYNAARASFNKLHSVVEMVGQNAGKWLVSAAAANPDEDERGLMALMLANDFTKTLDPLMLQTSGTFLTGLLSQSEGTSCKMAIAWALYNMNSKKEWEDLVYGNYFIKKDGLLIFEKIFEETYPAFNESEFKDKLCRELAVVGSTDLPMPFPIFEPQDTRRGVLEHLAIDLASNGHAYRNYPNWNRKPRS